MQLLIESTFSEDIDKIVALANHIDDFSARELNMVLATSPGLGKEGVEKSHGFIHPYAAKELIEHFLNIRTYSYAYLTGTPIVIRGDNNYKLAQAISKVESAFEEVRRSNFLVGKDFSFDHLHSIVIHEANNFYAGLAYRNYKPIVIVVEDIPTTFHAEVLLHEARHEADYALPFFKDVLDAEYKQPTTDIKYHPWFGTYNEVKGRFGRLLLELRAYHMGSEFLLHQLRNKALSGSRSDREDAKRSIDRSIQLSKTALKAVGSQMNKFREIPNLEEFVKQIETSWSDLETDFREHKAQNI